VRPYPGRTALFALAQRDGMTDSLYDPLVGEIDPQLGWGPIAAGGVDVQELPGGHVTIFQEPHVRILAEKLKDCLEKARGVAAS
jgi:thioesterase domain-containing protein